MKKKVVSVILAMTMVASMAMGWRKRALIQQHQTIQQQPQQQMMQQHPQRHPMQQTQQQMQQTET